MSRDPIFVAATFRDSIDDNGFIKVRFNEFWKSRRTVRQRAGLRVDCIYSFRWGLRWRERRKLSF